MSNTYLATVPSGIQKSVQAEWGFPEDCLVLRGNVSTSDRQAKDKAMMFIIYAGAPGSNFNNAPLGAVLFDTSNYKTHIKTAAAGTGTWKSSAAYT